MVVLVSIDRKRSFVFDSLNCLYGKTNSLWRYIYVRCLQKETRKNERQNEKKA